MARANNHWDGSYSTGDSHYVPASKNHIERVYNGPSQHNTDPHQKSSGCGECSADELSKEADEYLKLIHP